MECGITLPHESNWEFIAEALNIDLAKLYRRAGKQVPEGLRSFSKEGACKKLLYFLTSSRSSVEFLVNMLALWQSYAQSELDLPGYVNYKVDLPDFIATIFEPFNKLSEQQRLQVIKVMVNDIQRLKLVKVIPNYQVLLDQIDQVMLKLDHALEPDTELMITVPEPFEY